MSSKPELSPKGMNEILDYIYNGRKVAACKRYMELRREESGESPSLLEAKTFIERLTTELKAAEPEKFTNQKQGCVTVSVCLISTITGVVWNLI